MANKVSLQEVLVVLRSTTDDRVFWALAPLLEALRDDIQTLLAKLDDDTGVHDTDYQSTITKFGA
jgi:hypothetical protein